MKKFGAYAKEFIVITVSITIAFWVENYRESRKEAADTRALLSIIESEIKSQEDYLKFLSEFADKHSLRFDSLVTDLEDQKIERAQLLTDISIAYVPYITDVGENAGFESLKNSGLMSAFENDTLVSALFYQNTKMRGVLNAYSEGWKNCQGRVKTLVAGVCGREIHYDFGKSHATLYTAKPIQVTADVSEKLRFEIVSWITLMKQYQVFIDNQRKDLKGMREYFWKDE